MARAFSENGFRSAFASLGCSVPRGLRLVTNVHGRFYLNLTSFMRIAAQVPGLDPKTLLDLGGGTSIDILESQVADVSKRGFYARLPLTAGRLLGEQMRLGGEVDRFEVHADRAARRLVRDGPHHFAGRRARDDAERRTKAPRASGDADALVRERVAREPRRAEDRARALDARGRRAHRAGALRGHRRSRKRASWHCPRHVAAIARHDEPARSRLEANHLRSPADLPDGPTQRALLQFLETYGDRAVREAELVTPRWREDPSPLLGMLRAGLSAKDADPESSIVRARANADRELSQLEERLSLVEMTLVRALVTRSQRFARLRERMRAWVTRVLGMLRAIALDVDRRLLRLDPTIGEGGVFFCTFDELVDALTSGRTRARRARAYPPRRIRARCRASRSAGHVHRQAARSSSCRPQPAWCCADCRPAAASSKGARASSFRRAAGAGELRAGEILVARTTDVGLSPLFLVAAAVVTELGGPLSHAALVAREYGVPAVVNVLGATTAIRTGDHLRVDGDRGIVERLRQVEDEDAAP